MSLLLLGGGTAALLRRSESSFCGYTDLHHKGAAQRLRKDTVQAGLEGMPSGTGSGEKMVKHMKEIRWPEPEIDFDIVDYEEENV
jgi:hypothetical protein